MFCCAAQAFHFVPSGLSNHDAEALFGGAKLHAAEYILAPSNQLIVHPSLLHLFQSGHVCLVLTTIYDPDFRVRYKLLTLGQSP